MSKGFQSGARGNVPSGLLNKLGADWQKNRRIISPTFSAKKLKLVSYYSYT